ncbi:MAG: 6-phosphofructokinase, partial [Deltaproteobacteria bacterium]|nr:6-phosphofructokinase [Deltaproteobacteria bacterium]
MPAPNGIEAILSNPDVQKITSKINPELVSHRKMAPALCGVFASPVTRLQEKDGFVFEIDTDARRQLPNIIHNKVQAVQGADATDENLLESYRKRRRIGIVFSGGPAPGGHNVIAGIFDAAKKANPDTQIWGFLMGPDGVIENRAVELTPERIQQYLNLGGFGMIKTGRAKIDTQKKMNLSRETCTSLGLYALL